MPQINERGKRETSLSSNFIFSPSRSSPLLSNMIFFILSNLLSFLFYIFRKENRWGHGLLFIPTFSLAYVFLIEEFIPGRDLIIPISNLLTFMGLWFFVISFPILLQQFPRSPLIWSAFFIILLRCLKIFKEDRYLLFFIFFEIRVFPIILILLRGGKRKFRLEACLYLLFFTIFSSVFFIFGLFFLMRHNINTYRRSIYENFSNSQNNSFSTQLTFFLLFRPFFAKFPIFFFHVWLPKAHVEAPTLGSMILAGVLLKLGGIWNNLFFQKFIPLGRSLHILSMLFPLWGSVYAGIICFKQEDSKVLIAYSRVNHIGLVIFGLLQSTSICLYGGTLLIVSHGFLSSLIFYLNGSHYSSLSTRNIIFIKQNSPLVMAIWIFVTFANTGMPIFLRFWGEIIIGYSIIYYFSLIPVFFSLFSPENFICYYSS